MSNFTISQFKCIQCNEAIFLPRKRSNQRKKNHLKKIFCIKCKEEINHLEIREFDWEESHV